MTRDQVFAVLLNLDSASPNCNIVSLFQHGVRVSPPQPIPEALKGKSLVPTINYKNMVLRVNFGSGQLAPLPFSCRSLQDAASDDVEVFQKKASQGPREVVVPVGLPDEGAFLW